MSDANLIKDKIREELEKGMPSKRKVLSYLLDLLKKDKYPSLSDFDFYDIIGYTYKLNLDYKLNLEMLFYPIYNGLKKKIKKLYGKEKRLEMEQYLIEKFGIYGPEKKIGKKQQKQYSPRSSFTTIKYVLSALVLITGIITLIIGVFVYSFVSKSAGITSAIIGIILILSGICIISKTSRRLYDCCIEIS